VEKLRSECVDFEYMFVALALFCIHCVYVYAAAPVGWRHNALLAVICPSVRPSVPCLTLSRERKSV